MFRKCLTALLMLMLLPLAVQAESAEDHFDYCAQLSAADCQILEKSEAVMMEVESAAFDMEMTMAMDSGDAPFSLSAAGSGKAQFTPEALDALDGLDEMMKSEPPASTESMTSIIEMVLPGIRAEVLMDIESTSGGETTEMSMHLRMDENVLYLDPGGLLLMMEMLVPEEDADSEDAEGSGAAMGGMGMGMMGGMEGMAGGMGFDLTGSVEMLMMTLESDSETKDYGDMDEAAMAEAMRGAVTTMRLPDSEIAGSAVAVFDITIEGAGVSDMLDSLSAGLGMAHDAELSAMLAGSQMTLRQYIGLEDFYLHRLEASLMGADGQASPMSMQMHLNLSEFNAPIEVAMPEDAFVLPLAMMLMMMQMDS